MLLSELEERERRFKLALRAGVPVVLLVSLVFYGTFFTNEKFSFDLQKTVLFGSLVFITVYFIYFLMELSIKESLIDQTTQGFNEKAFIKKLNEYQPKTIVLLIIRNLSTINEHYSAEAVDRLLYTIIHKLNHTLRQEKLPKALIARRYGAEFLVAIDENREDIEDIFQRFIKNHCTLDGIEIDYAFAAITNTGKEFDKEIQHLKQLIFMQDKKTSDSGSSNTVIDSKALSDIESSILQTLEEKYFSLSFRPLSNTHTQEIDIYEISAKLRSDNIGEILPRVYLPIINRLGKGRQYDIGLVEHILKLLPLIDEKISLSFNLSPFSLRDTHFQESFFQMLEESGVLPKRIIIELYERRTHHDLGGYLKTLEKFRAKGVRIAIDNFGSSNASIEYMKHFRFDLVQFDRDYVTKLEDHNTRAMLNSLVQMAKELQVTTVAKWVDKPVQKQQLISMGIDYLQGFGIAKPIDEHTLIQQYNP